VQDSTYTSRSFVSFTTALGSLPGGILFNDLQPASSLTPVSMVLGSC